MIKDKRHQIEARDVYFDLVTQALIDGVLYGPWVKTKYKVGTGLNRLTPEQREVIKNLKSSETFELRLPECLP